MLRTSTTHATDIEGVIVHLSGTAGMADLDQFSMLLDSIAAAAPPPRRVILDFEGLELLTSICIGKLITFRQSVLSACEADGRGTGRIVIAGAQSWVNQSLRFTRLDALFEMFPDVATARAALKA